MKLLLEKDIRFTGNDYQKIYHYDEEMTTQRLLSLIQMLKRHYQELFNFEYNDNLFKDYESFYNNIINEDLSNINYLRFRSNNNLHFRFNFKTNTLTINYYEKINEKINSKITYYQYEDKIIKHDEAEDNFYEYDDKTNKWYQNQRYYDEFYKYGNYFKEIEFDETQRGLKK